MKVKPVYSESEGYPNLSKYFRGYTHDSGGTIDERFSELEKFAQMFGFKIVDRYTSFDKEAGHHIPVIEVY